VVGDLDVAGDGLRESNLGRGSGAEQARPAAPHGAGGDDEGGQVREGGHRQRRRRPAQRRGRDDTREVEVPHAIGGRDDERVDERHAVATGALELFVLSIEFHRGEEIAAELGRGLSYAARGG